MDVEVIPEPGQAKVNNYPAKIDVKDLKMGHSKERLQSIILIKSPGGFEWTMC